MCVSLAVVRRGAFRARRSSTQRAVEAQADDEVCLLFHGRYDAVSSRFQGFLLRTKQEQSSPPILLQKGYPQRHPVALERM